MSEYIFFVSVYRDKKGMPLIHQFEIPAVYVSELYYYICKEDNKMRQEHEIGYMVTCQRFDSVEEITDYIVQLFEAYNGVASVI